MADARTFRIRVAAESCPEADPSFLFGAQLNSFLFFPIDHNLGFPIKGRDVIRVSQALLQRGLNKITHLVVGASCEMEEGAKLLQDTKPHILAAMGIDVNDEPHQKNLEFIQTPGLYDDIGRDIRRANHPPLGTNTLRDFDRGEPESVRQP